MDTLIISVLFVYGLTFLVADTDGPFGIFYRLRKHVSPVGCFACTSVWFAAFASATTARNAVDWAGHIFVIAGGAIFLYTLRRN